MSRFQSTRSQVPAWKRNVPEALPRPTILRQAGAWERGFTLVELLVVIAIIAVLVAILVPAVGRVKANGRSTQSKHHLDQLGKGLKHYEGLGKGGLRHEGWEDRIRPYVDEQHKVFIDPGDTNGPVSYALSSKVVKMGSGDYKKIAIVESDDAAIVIDNTNCTGGVSTVEGEVAVRHLGMTNALMYGGSVRTFEPVDIDLHDTSHKPLVIWWLPDREHGLVCGTVVVITNPNPLPGPTGTEPDTTLTPDPTSDPSGSAPPSELCPELNEGLRAHYTFDDTGDPGADSSGNGYDATVIGAVIEDDSERCGSVLRFSEGGASDVDDVMWLPDGVLHGVGDSTVTFWIKADDGDPTPGTTTDEWYIVSGHGPGDHSYLDNSTLYGIYKDGFFIIWNHGVKTQWNSSPLSYSGSWRHLAMVRDLTNNEHRLYVDGQELAGGALRNGSQTTLEPTSITPGTLLVGQDQDCPGGCFQVHQRLEGTIDDLRFYERVLTDDEIATLAGQ